MELQINNQHKYNNYVHNQTNNCNQKITNQNTIIEDVGNKMNHLIKNKINHLDYNKKNQKK